MSLIERAVARLTTTPRSSTPPQFQQVAPPTPPLPSDESKPPAAGQPGTIAAQRHARSTVPTSVSLQSRFGQSVQLPLTQMRDRGFLIPSDRATVTGYEFRLIKGPLLEKAFGTESQRLKNGNRIALTSARPGEGKTFCSLNLAMSIAATGDRSVLLVDADVAKLAATKQLGIDEQQPGLMDALVGEADDDPLKYILPTDVKGLYVMPAGRSRAHAGEYLAGPTVGSLLDRLSTELSDWIFVIDTPPILAVTETRAVLQKVGQIIMVVAAGETPRRSVETALSGLPDGIDVRIVLNKTSESTSQLDYYYGY